MQSLIQPQKAYLCDGASFWFQFKSARLQMLSVRVLISFEWKLRNKLEIGWIHSDRLTNTLSFNHRNPKMKSFCLTFQCAAFKLKTMWDSLILASLKRICLKHAMFCLTNDVRTNSIDFPGRFRSVRVCVTTPCILGRIHTGVSFNSKQRTIPPNDLYY